MRKKLRVIVLMGGRSPEYEVSLVSGQEVVKHLDPTKYEVLPVVISKDGQRWLMKGEVDEEIKLGEISRRADIIFIAIHGPFGEDGTIQGFLELLGIPYTGSGVLASALGMDKPMFREMMRGLRIPMPKFIVLRQGSEDLVRQRFSLPVVVKPSSQGSSVGVSIVHKKSDLKKAFCRAFKFGPRVMVEEFLSGMEVSCGVLGNKNPSALPVIEIAPRGEFFDYEAKYVPGMSEEIVPARIPDKLTKKVQEIAVKVYERVGCWGFGRVDMIIRDGVPHVLEINTIPGLTPNSLLPKEAAAAGITYGCLIEKIIQFALDRKVYV